MTANFQDIKRWVDEGRAAGATHLIVAHDTYDHENYPVYVQKGQDPHAKADDILKSSTQVIDEVYWLECDKRGIARQLGMHRAHVYGPEDLGPDPTPRPKAKPPSKPRSQKSFLVMCLTEDMSYGCPEEGAYPDPDHWSVAAGPFATAQIARGAMQNLAAKRSACYRHTYFIVEGCVVPHDAGSDR